jgi:hypothetical protein
LIFFVVTDPKSRNEKVQNPRREAGTYAAFKRRKPNVAAALFA